MNTYGTSDKYESNVSKEGLEIAKSVFPDYEDAKVEKPHEKLKQIHSDDEIALKDECERLQEHIGVREKPDENELQ